MRVSTIVIPTFVNFAGFFSLFPPPPRECTLLFSSFSNIFLFLITMSFCSQMPDSFLTSVFSPLLTKLLPANADCPISTGGGVVLCGPTCSMWNIGQSIFRKNKRIQSFSIQCEKFESLFEGGAHIVNQDCSARSFRRNELCRHF